jgi:hypothetical protein
LRTEQPGSANDMAIVSIRRKSKKQRAMSVASKATSAAVKFAKARIAWLAGKKAAKLAAPAVAVGTAAVVVKKRSASHDAPAEPAPTNAHATPAGVA